MLVLVLSVIASPEGKVYLELSSNVKKWGKSQQGNYDPRPSFYSCWSQQKETCIRSFFFQEHAKQFNWWVRKTYVVLIFLPFSQKWNSECNERINIFPHKM